MKIGQISISRDGQSVTVMSPYSESNNSDFRARGGRYSKDSGWTFASSPATDKMLLELFGFDGITGEAVTAIVPESKINTRYSAPWQIDGYVVASRRGRDSRVESPDGVQLYEGAWSSSGGSMKSPRVTSSETVILHVVMPKALAERHGLALVGTVPAVPAAPVEERPFSIIDGTPVPYSLTVRCARPCCKNGDDVQAVNHLVDIQDFLQRARPSQKLIRFEGAYAFYGEPYVPGALEAPKLLNTRVPQPNRETADYGVPPFVVDAAAVLYHHRNACPEEEIEIVDQAIVRLYQPWIRKSIGEGL